MLFTNLTDTVAATNTLYLQSAGSVCQNEYSVAIGICAGAINQGAFSTAVGPFAGINYQGSCAVV